MALEKNSAIHREIRRRLVNYDEVRRVVLAWDKGRIPSEVALQELIQVVKGN